MAPFSTPELVLFDSLRVYVALLTVVVSVAMASEFIHGQPSLGRYLQVARRIFLGAMALILLSDAGAALSRIGTIPLVPSRMFGVALGVTLLVLWIVFERKARKDPT